MTTCETCGGHVELIGVAEGTRHYEPLEGELLELLRDLEDRRGCRLATGGVSYCLVHGFSLPCPQARLRELLIRYGSLAQVDGEAGN